MSGISVTVLSVFRRLGGPPDPRPSTDPILADRRRGVITATLYHSPNRLGCGILTTRSPGSSNPYNRTFDEDLADSGGREDWWHLAFGIGETG